MMPPPPPIRGPFRTDLRARAAYSEGAGAYRMVPLSVAVPAVSLWPPLVYSGVHEWEGTSIVSNPELAALVEQAARNLDTLELLARSAGDEPPGVLAELRQRLRALRLAYVRETDALTQFALQRAVERRTSADRRGQQIRLD